MTDSRQKARRVLTIGGWPIFAPGVEEYPRLLSSGDGFMPHGHYYVWTPGLVWLQVISNALIVVAYFSITIALVYFVPNRKKLDLCSQKISQETRGIFPVGPAGEHLRYSSSVEAKGKLVNEL